MGRRILAGILVALLLLGMAGCKTPDAQEEAVVDQYIVGDPDGIEYTTQPESSETKEPEAEQTNEPTVPEQPLEENPQESPGKEPEQPILDQREKIMTMQEMVPIKRDPVPLSAEDQATVLQWFEAGPWTDQPVDSYPIIKICYDGKEYSFRGGCFYGNDGRALVASAFEYKERDTLINKYIQKVEGPFNVPNHPDEMLAVSADFSSQRQEKFNISVGDKDKIIQLLNSSEWKKSYPSVVTDFCLYIGTAIYCYDSVTGMVYVSGSSSWHIILDAETTKKINNILAPYLSEVKKNDGTPVLTNL